MPDANYMQNALLIIAVVAVILLALEVYTHIFKPDKHDYSEWEE